MHETMVYTGHAADVLAEVRRRCLAYPEAHEVEQFGHPWFKAGKRPFVVFGGMNEAPAIHFAIGSEDQAALCEMAPDLFFPTPYMHQHGWTSMRVGVVDWDAVAQLMDDAYRRVALKRMLPALDG